MAQAHDRRLMQIDELQKESNERVGRVESNLARVDSNICDLRSDFNCNAQTSFKHQKEMAEAMTMLTKELREMRLSQQEARNTQEQAPAFVNYQRTKDPPKPMAPRVKENVSMRIRAS